VQKFGQQGYDAAVTLMQQLKERHCYIATFKDELKSLE
jgi:hypothetical protein